MSNKYQEHKQFLEEQLHWCSERDGILEKIEVKLHEMKRIAEYAREQELSTLEINWLNDQLNELKSEVVSLEKQLHSVLH
jgi:Tfp pilus assembly protein PilO